MWPPVWKSTEVYGSGHTPVENLGSCGTTTASVARNWLSSRHFFFRKSTVPRSKQLETCHGRAESHWIPSKVSSARSNGRALTSGLRLLQYAIVYIVCYTHKHIYIYICNASNLYSPFGIDFMSHDYKTTNVAVSNMFYMFTTSVTPVWTCWHPSPRPDKFLSKRKRGKQLRRFWTVPQGKQLLHCTLQARHLKGIAR